MSEDDLIFEMLVEGKREYENAKLAIKTYDENQETIANQQREIAELKELMREMLAVMVDLKVDRDFEVGNCMGADELWSNNLMPECMVKAKELLSEDK